MEIIAERLEREFDLDLVTTAPSVIYKVTTMDGETVSVDNPSNLPDIATIEYMEEPITNAHIISPPDYVGAIMDLCQEKRGVFKDMQYLDQTRVQINYDFTAKMKIIYDFFDTLKVQNQRLCITLTMIFQAMCRVTWLSWIYC